MYYFPPKYEFDRPFFNANNLDIEEVRESVGGFLDALQEEYPTLDLSWCYKQDEIVLGKYTHSEYGVFIYAWLNRYVECMTEAVAYCGFNYDKDKKEKDRWKFSDELSKRFKKFVKEHY